MIWPKRVISAKEDEKLVSPQLYVDEERAEGRSAVLLMLHAKTLEKSFFPFPFLFLFFSFYLFLFFFLLIFLQFSSGQMRLFFHVE